MVAAIDDWGRIKDGARMINGRRIVNWTRTLDDRHRPRLRDKFNFIPLGLHALSVGYVVAILKAACVA
jgi:hypothetical protein